MLNCLCEVADRAEDLWPREDHLMRSVNDTTEENFMVQDVILDVIDDEELVRLMD